MREREVCFRSVDKPLITKPFIFFLVIFLIGTYFIALRFVKGIGYVSNMSDGYPWGIWIAYDVVVGTALGCGGYALALLIYVMGKRQYYPLIRGAILTSALGYTLAGASVIIDIGRYWNVYHFFIPSHWNLNSPLLEVALCVMTYILVLWIEFSPAIGEKLGWDQERLEKITKVAVLLGVVLPTMHQSSLGSVELVSMTKLHPAWHTAFLPLLFLMSCILMGYAVVCAESLLSSLFFNRPFEMEILGGLAKYARLFGFWWVGLRILVLVIEGKLIKALSAGWLTGMLFLEILLFLLPSFMLLSREARYSPRKLFVASVLYLLGGALYRFNAYLIAWSPGPGWAYFPSFAETMITLGIVSLEVLAYLIFVKKFPVLPKVEKAKGV